jgi:hypothetical protein
MTFKTGVKINKVSKGMQLFFADMLAYKSRQSYAKRRISQSQKNRLIGLRKKN